MERLSNVYKRIFFYQKPHATHHMFNICLPLFVPPLAATEFDIQSNANEPSKSYFEYNPYVTTWINDSNVIFSTSNRIREKDML